MENKTVSKAVFVGGLVLALSVGFWLGKVSYEKKGKIVEPNAITLEEVKSVTGTVKRVAAGSIFIELSENLPPEEREVVVGSDTEITRNSSNAEIKDLRAGDLIFINSKENIKNAPRFGAETIFVKVSAE